MTGAPVAQLSELVGGLEEIYARALVGVYVHGSLALGCFRPERSDVDVLVVTSGPATARQRGALAALLPAASAPKSWPRAGRYPLELSIVASASLHPWRHPAPFDVHYSERRGTVGPGCDPDLAAHVTVVRHAGITLLGPPAVETFPLVPWADYASALLADLADCGRDPTGFYAVLSPVRIWATLATREPHSKESGALWALPRLQPEHRPLVEHALAIYRAECDWHDFEPQAVRSLVDEVSARSRVTGGEI